MRISELSQQISIVGVIINFRIKGLGVNRGSVLSILLQNKIV